LVKGVELLKPLGLEEDSLCKFTSLKKIGEEVFHNDLDTMAGAGLLLKFRNKYITLNRSRQIITSWSGLSYHFYVPNSGTQ
jgi:hypothetical protein